MDSTGEFGRVLEADGSSAGDVTRRNFVSRALGLAALPLAGMLGEEAWAGTPDADEKGGHGFYKIVSYEVPAEHWKEFLKACRVNAEASQKDRGVTSFELLVPRGAANRMVAVEAYVNEDASKAHQQTAHFHAFADVAQRLGVTRTVVEAERYLPG